MTEEYPWKNTESDECFKSDLADLGMGKAIEKSRERINQKARKADDILAPYVPNVDAMYYSVLCGLSSYFRLNPTKTAVLCFVAAFHRKGLSCYASKELIARALGVSSVTVFNALKYLKGKGLLEQYYYEDSVHLKLGPEAIDRWKYHEKLIETSKNDKKNLRKPKNTW